ncbi:MAG TPA: flagellin [Pseudomonadales bacterium]
MAQVINTNIASLNAQRNLNTSQGALHTALQRLSSGLRINSAKDDAAGLAISERMTAQIRGLNQAMRNANDGISFAQTAEGALGEVGNALQRIRELAVQSANDTNSASDRQALNNEVQQLIAEVNRIAGSTQFNGQNILDGTSSELVFQVGANQGQTISVNGVDARGSQLGAATTEGISFKRADFSTISDLTVNGVTVDMTGVEDAQSLINAINKVSADSGVTARQATETTFSSQGFDSASPATVTINGVNISVTTGMTIADFTDAVNALSAQTGVTASHDSTDVTFTASDGSAVDVVDADSVLGASNATQGTWEAGIVLSTEVGGDITVGGAGASTDALGLTGLAAAEDQALTAVDVLTRETATDALLTIDYALDMVNGLRAQLGAVQSRFESTIANLSTSVENASAARSRIMDADFAAETAALTRAQILQQAGTSVLAQANQTPQNVLSLLQ